MDNLRDRTSRTLTSWCRNRDCCARLGSPQDYRLGNEKAANIVSIMADDLSQALTPNVVGKPGLRVIGGPGE